MITKLPLSLPVSILLGLIPIVLFAQDPKYNVLFIIVDDMNDRNVLNGNTEVYSPNLKRLAEHGMVFNMAYCQYPLCNPSRTSILTGFRPDKTGVINNEVRPRSVLDSATIFLPEYFKQHGYHTERYGKILHGTFENDINWDYAEPPEIIRDTTGNDTSYGEVRWWIKDLPDTLIPDNIWSRHLVSSMRQPRTQLFFYGLGLYAHAPFTPALRYWNMNGDPSVQELLPINKKGTLTDLKGNGSENIVLPGTPPGDRNDIPPVAFAGPQQIIDEPTWKKAIHAYDAEVSQMDAQLGLVLDEMDRQQLWDNTVVVFLSDHGQHLGEHEGTWNKYTLFEESVHVPLVVCAPGKRTGVCSKLVELVDLYPTLSELCGLPVASDLEGTSFVPLLDNPAFQWKKAVFSQAARTKDNDGTSIRIKRYKYNLWGPAGEELYNHNPDPHEYTNLAVTYADTALLNRMKGMLAAGWTESLPPKYPKVFYYRDADGDKYGSNIDSLSSYWPPRGFVSNNTDCDDTNPGIHFGATELCDGLDNNCNGQVDETCLPAISISDKGIAEGNIGTKTMKFTVVLNHPYVKKITLRIATADNTATSGTDYAGDTGTLTFLPGQTLKYISVFIFGDSQPEPNENFKVLLSKPVNAMLSDSLAIGIIWDNDTILNEMQINDPITLKIAAGITKTSAKVWPNPTHNFINVQLIPSSAKITTVQLFNMKGDILKEWKFSPSVKHSTQQLNTAGIVNGVYTLIITDHKGDIHSKRVIINH